MVTEGREKRSRFRVRPGASLSGHFFSMARSPKRNIPDLIFGALSLALAGVCIYFAAYMVIRLQNMEDPPADMGLNFPAKKDRRSETEAVLVDPLITSSIEPADEAQPARRIRQPYTRDQPVLNYQLLTVIDGIAFVELTRIKGKEVWPVREGSILPGAGRVDVIEKVADRWRLATGTVMIEALAQ
jgi:hypothetical protein